MKNRNLRIVYITNGISGAGGLERVLSIKASYLAEKLNYEVHILTLNQGNSELFYEFSPRIIYHDVKAIGNPINYFLNYIKGIKRVIKTVKPDVISVCDDGLKGFLLPILLRKPCPMVYERHVSQNIEIRLGDPIHRKLLAKGKWVLMEKLSSFYDRFIVLTKGNVLEWENLKNIQIIPNPLSFFPDQVSTVKSKNVIAVGKHGFQKGYDLLLHAWQLIQQSNFGWQINIYGKKDSQFGLDELTGKLGLSETVNFWEPDNNILKRYLESTIYVMSSRFEGFGMVLIEAMACGLPCVSFDCPHGPADIITDGVDGFLVENGNIQGLADKLMILMNDQQLRIEMGQNARRKVVRYLPDNVMPMWDELFKSLISDN